jgi:hypothetical protein
VSAIEHDDIIYMCEKDAVAQAFSAAKNEKHPYELFQNEGGFDGHL